MGTIQDSKVISVAHHRNGVGGMPFYVVLFECGEMNQTMVAVSFEDDEGEGYQNPRVAILGVDLLAKNDIAFGSNSWRGDRYASFVRGAIEKYNAASSPTQRAWRALGGELPPEAVAPSTAARGEGQA